MKGPFLSRLGRPFVDTRSRVLICRKFPRVRVTVKPAKFTCYPLCNGRSRLDSLRIHQSDLSTEETPEIRPRRQPSSRRRLASWVTWPLALAVVLVSILQTTVGECTGRAGFRNFNIPDFFCIVELGAPDSWMEDYVTVYSTPKGIICASLWSHWFKFILTISTLPSRPEAKKKNAKLKKKIFEEHIFLKLIKDRVS